MTHEILELTAAQAAAAVRAGELDPAELFDAYRARAAADRLNAFLWLAEESPADVGRASGQPLGGVPLAVKDLFCTEGVPSQAGSKILEGYRPPYTATVVAQVAEAGAPLLGKTNQDEFAMGSSTENSALAPLATPGTSLECPAGPREAARRRSPRARPPGRLAPTPEDRSASPLRCAESLG